jgi:hypothetical protein
VLPTLLRLLYRRKKTPEDPISPEIPADIA